MDDNYYITNLDFLLHAFLRKVHSTAEPCAYIRPVVDRPRNQRVEFSWVEESSTDNFLISAPRNSERPSAGQPSAVENCYLPLRRSLRKHHDRYIAPRLWNYPCAGDLAVKICWIFVDRSFLERAVWEDATRPSRRDRIETRLHLFLIFEKILIFSWMSSQSTSRQSKRDPLRPDRANNLFVMYWAYLWAAEKWIARFVALIADHPSSIE